MRSFLLLLVSLALVILVASQPSPPSFPSMPGSDSDSDDTDAFSLYQMMPSPDDSAYDVEDLLAITDDGQLVQLGKKGSFHMPHPLAMMENAPQYETLPTITKDTQYLKPITRTTSAPDTSPTGTPSPCPPATPPHRLPPPPVLRRAAMWTRISSALTTHIPCSPSAPRSTRWAERVRCAAVVLCRFSPRPSSSPCCSRGSWNSPLSERGS